MNKNDPSEFNDTMLKGSRQEHLALPSSVREDADDGEERVVLLGGLCAQLRPELSQVGLHLVAVLKKAKRSEKLATLIKLQRIIL